eukprot:6199243-Pleurochrysis_carterae.AAC.1
MSRSVVQISRPKHSTIQDAGDDERAYVCGERDVASCSSRGRRAHALAYVSRCCFGSRAKPAGSASIPGWWAIGVWQGRLDEAKVAWNNRKASATAAALGCRPRYGEELDFHSGDHVRNTIKWTHIGLLFVRQADRICSFNRHYAEYAGYWKNTNYLKEVDRNQPTVYYDSVSGKPLFVAPIGRSLDEFLAESASHGWPSFRDQEVRCRAWLPGGSSALKNVLTLLAANSGRMRIMMHAHHSRVRARTWCWTIRPSILWRSMQFELQELALI